MARKPSGLLALVLLCGVGQAGEPVAVGPPFIGHLRQATVELVGVTHYPPAKKSRWWRPDGPAAQIGPYLHQKGKRGGLQVHRGRRGVTFLIRLGHPAPEQPSYEHDGNDQSAADTSRPARYRPTERPSYEHDRYERSAHDALRPVHMFKPWGQSPEVDYVARLRTGISSRRLNLFSPYWWSGSVVDTEGNFIHDYYMFSAVVAAPAQTANFRVGLSMDAWETVASQEPDRAGRSSFIREGRQWFVTFYKATTSETGKTQVKLKTTLIWPEAYGRLAQRLVAVTSDGSEHATKWGLGNWKNGRTIIYDLPLSSIKEFRFQVSPYDWVEFNNVSLQPGQKTQVTVVPLGGP